MLALCVHTEKDLTLKGTLREFEEDVRVLVEWADDHSRTALYVIEEWPEACKKCKDFVPNYILPILEGKVGGVAVGGKVVFLLPGNVAGPCMEKHYAADEDEQRKIERSEEVRQLVLDACYVELSGLLRRPAIKTRFPILVLCPPPTLAVQRQLLEKEIRACFAEEKELPDEWQQHKECLSDALLDPAVWDCAGNSWRERKKTVRAALGGLLKKGCVANLAKKLDPGAWRLELECRGNDGSPRGVALCAVQQSGGGRDELAFVGLSTPTGASPPFLVLSR